MILSVSRYFYLLLLLLVSGIAGCTSSKNYGFVHVHDLAMSREDFTSNFKEVNAIVQRNFKHFKNKGINPDSLFAAYAAKVSQVENGTEYGHLLLQYFAELKNGHSNVYFNRDHMHAFARLVENRLFISGVQDERLLEQGVQVKDEILQIDGVPVLQWIEQQKAYVSASTEVGRTKSTVNVLVFSSYFKEKRTYQIRTATGVKEIPVQFEARTFPAGKPFRAVSHKSLSDSIGYIAINGMHGDVVPEFLNSYAQVKDKPALIIDIRNNGGGNSSFSESITKHLLKHNHTASVSKSGLKPTADSYKGQLYLLISTYTFSAAESFAIDLLEGAGAVVIGEPTAGDTGNGANQFTTSQGISFRIPTRGPRVSAGGFPMEGRSVEPHYPVGPTVESFLAGKDIVLDYTLDLIRKGGAALTILEATQHEQK